MLKIYSCLFLLCFTTAAFAQSDTIHEVKGIPTKQIFDLMVDRKGFLWAGHDMGISRYDGNSFTHFSSPESTSLAIGDICEDEQGRIWCRNFSSQIFYIENEKMHLLTAYDYTNEPRFPRMVIIGNKLVATSKKGLFVCNTATLQCSYIKHQKYPDSSATFSLSIVKNKIIVQGFKWFSYDPNTNKLSELSIDGEIQKLKSVNLQPYSYKDTLYSFSITSARITKMLLKGIAITYAGVVNTNGFMNTINPSGENTWIHSKKESVTLDESQKISGYDLSDLVTDKEGNTWYSSFTYGLLIKYKNNWEKIKNIMLDNKDVITHFYVNNNVTIYGTLNGKVIVENSISKKIIQTFALPVSAGPIEYIKSIDSSRIIIGSALRIYMLDHNFKTLRGLQPELTIKDAVLADTSVYLATATGLNELIYNKIKKQYQINIINNQRCRSIAYHKNTNTLLAAFKDGLFEIKHNQLTPILYKGMPIYASTLQDWKDKTFITTYNNGLFIADSSSVRKINSLGTHNLTSIFKIKIFKDTAWILGAGFIEAFDTKTERNFRNLIIPPLPNAAIYDIGENEGKVIILTSDGLYQLKRNSTNRFKLSTYLLKVSVNGADSSITNNIELPFDKNNIEMFLSAPYYTNPDKIFFKYRLSGTIDDDWKTSGNNERIFRYSSLKPGKYTFEAAAIHPQLDTVTDPVSFSFTILPPWYDTLLFKIAVIVVIGFIIYMFVKMFFKARLKQQKINYEKQLAVQTERQRLSAEIHDDIGASLSGVKLLTELTANNITDKGTQHEVNKIYTSITDLSAKMRDVIWSLNTNNDTLENLLEYIQRQSRQLLENSNIHLYVYLPDDIPALDITSDKRTDIYLSVKEALHNALKHSDAEKIELYFTIENDFLYITIIDNGKGIDASPANAGNGIINIKKRIRRIHGTVDFINDTGTKITFSIPLK